MIDPGDISRHYIVCKNKETTSIETAGESNFADEEVLYNAVGYSVFSVLKEKNIIFEGWNDKQLFQVALGSAAADIRKKYSGIGICHAKGTKSVKTITPMIELAGRECLIVSDSDSAAKDQQKIYRKEKGFGKWKTYQEIDPNIDAVTGEDFLKNSYLAKQIKNILPSSGISLSDLPATKGKIAVIKKLLITGGMTPEEAGDAIKQLKEICFEDLKASDIEPAYSKMLKALWTAL